MQRLWTGIGTALVTPFSRDGSLDEAGVRRLARRQIEAGVHFLVPCGTTGESPTLTGDERLRVVAAVVEEAAGKVPVLAGAGGYDTREVIRAAREMKTLGAAGILSVAPYYNKPTQEGLFQHYRAVALEVGAPVMVYNVPGRTGCNVEPATLARLAEVEHIVGVKEASGNMAQICEVCRVVPEDFLVLSGDDVMTLPVISVGGHGIISVIANEMPTEMAEMVTLAVNGDFRAARAIHRRLMPLMTANFVESNPIPVKAAMAAMGLIEEVYRLPMVPPSDASRRRILDALRATGLLQQEPVGASRA